jgi:hypothetical protein
MKFRLVFLFLWQYDWHFDRDCIKSILLLGSMDILVIILLIHEHGSSFHLFLSSSVCFFLSSFVLAVLGSWIQGLELNKQNTLPALFVLIFEIQSCFMPGLAWKTILLFVLSHISGITGMCHHAQPFTRPGGVLWTFCRASWNLSIPYFWLLNSWDYRLEPPYSAL